jgi:hypothetical protein
VKCIIVTGEVNTEHTSLLITFGFGNGGGKAGAHSVPVGSRPVWWFVSILLPKLSPSALRGMVVKPSILLPLDSANGAGSVASWLSSINPVEHASHRHHTFNFRIEARVLSESTCPLACRPPSPVIWRNGQDLTIAPPMPLRNEIEEGAVHITQDGGTVSAEKRGFDDGIAAGGKMPGTGELYDDPTGEFDAGGGEILRFGRALRERPSLREAITGNLDDNGEVQRPECQIHEMDSEVQQAASSRERSVIKPGFVGAVCIVKDEAGGVDLTQCAVVDEAPDVCHGFRRAIGELDAE